MPSTARPPLPMPEISCVNPLNYRSALEQLFADHGRADHSEFFARAYPGAVAQGAKAWIGADREGRVVMHASRFPHWFMFGDVKVTGGLIVNILVATPYRTHHPARALTRSSDSGTTASKTPTPRSPRSSAASSAASATGSS